MCFFRPLVSPDNNHVFAPNHSELLREKPTKEAPSLLPLRSMPKLSGLPPSDDLWLMSTLRLQECQKPQPPLLLKKVSQYTSIFSGSQKGPAERGHVKNRQKVSKSFSTLFDNFAQGKKRQKSSKSVKKFFDIFRAAPFFRPLLQSAEICIAVRLQSVLRCFRCPYALRKGKYCQYSSHLHRSTPPICIAIRLPFASQYFWKSLGGCGHREVPPKMRFFCRCRLGLSTSGDAPLLFFESVHTPSTICVPWSVDHVDDRVQGSEQVLPRAKIRS